jgi:hypothetical protein
VGKPPPGVTGKIRYATLLELKSLSMSRASSTVCSVDEAWAEEGSGLRPLTVSPPPPRAVPSSSSTLKLASARVGPREDDPTVLVIPCPRCPWTPDVPLSQRAKLEAFLDNDGQVSNLQHLHTLRSAGLSRDAHLKLLLEWKDEDRRAFFESIDPAEITPWDKMQLLKRLSRMSAASKMAGLAPRIDGSERSWSVWQPGRVDEELLTDPSKPLSLLEDAMELGNHEVFQDILVSLLSFSPFESPSNAHNRITFRPLQTPIFPPTSRHLPSLKTRSRSSPTIG